MTRKAMHLTRSDWASDAALWRGRVEGKDLSTDVTVLFFTTDKIGQGPRWHVHTYDELFIVRAGRALFTVGDEKIEAQAGDILFGPAGVPHKYHNLGPGRLETTDIHLSDRFFQTNLDDPEVPEQGDRTMKVCIVGASGKLGRYMIQHCLERGYEVVGVCREGSVDKLNGFKGRITIVPGMTNDRDVIKRAVAGCDGVLTVLVPWGMNNYASGTAQAVLDFAPPDARLVFSCGWHITRDGKDVYSWKLKAMIALFGFFGRLFRVVDINDQVEACRRIFASATNWTVVRGSDLEEGESQGLPAWSRHVGDPILASNLTRRIDFALFMVEALQNDALIQETPAIVGRSTPSAIAYS